MKLELKHIQPYPPTLKIMWEGVYCRFEGIDFDNDSIILERVNVPLDEIKPILRPISDLVNYYDEICYNLYDSRNPNNYKFVKFEIDEVIKNGVWFETDYGFVSWLFKNHFDVFGLIKKGLAIDINTLKS